MPNLENYYELNNISKSDDPDYNDITSTSEEVRDSFSATSNSSENDSGLADVKHDCNDNSSEAGEKSASSADCVHDVEKLPEVIFNCSLLHYDKLLTEQSPDLKKIKSQLGHSISFGDIPLFPPLTRKKVILDDSSCTEVKIEDDISEDNIQ